jgi:hypothetical protein
MIVVRNVFQLKFGKAKEAVAISREGMALFKKPGSTKDSRLLTDVSGPFYTLVMENSFDSLADFERAGKEVMSKDEWHAWYARFTPLCEGGHREIYSVVE